MEAQTNTRTNYPQMLSGPLQGRLLRMLVSLSRPQGIGNRTSQVILRFAWLLGLPEGGRLDTLEINDELEELIRKAGGGRSGR